MDIIETVFEAAIVQRIGWTLYEVRIINALDI